jgi:hypothetical protein
MNKIHAMNPYMSGYDNWSGDFGWSYGVGGGGGGMSVGRFLDKALNNSYGGSWHNGEAHFFTSHAEAFFSAAAQITSTNGWGATAYGGMEGSLVAFGIITASGEIPTQGEVNAILHPATSSLNGSDPDPWYVLAWNSFVNQASKAWNSDIGRAIIQDNITLEFNVSSAIIVGGSGTYTVILFTRGPDIGFHFTKTFQESYGLELIGFGANLGLNHFGGNLNMMNSSTLLGRTDTVSAGWFYSGNVNMGYLNANDPVPIWTGVSAGVGSTWGAAYSTGTTYQWRPFK